MLTQAHGVDDFDCGVIELNLFLQRYAKGNSKNGSAKTFVTCRSGTDEVVGYYSINCGSVIHVEAPDRLSKGLPRHEIPVILLSRLAVDQSFRGKGLGPELVRDAFLRIIRISDEVGCRAVVVDAKDSGVAAFYKKLGFLAFDANPLRLFVLMKDVRKSVGV
ncbi:MAG: GNAT family N-acetyltransferase [Verrucomicrobiota bacterium]